MAKETIYLANLKASEQFGDNLLKGAICIDDVMEILESEQVQNLTYEYEGKTFVNIEVVKRKKANDFKKTHYIKISDFKPDSSKQKTAAKTPANDNTSVESGNKKAAKKPRTRKKAATSK